MARIVGGSIFGDIRGKLGGSVFSKNRAGAYIRAYTVPVNPRTPAQDRARARFGAASALYHSLAAAVKAQWGAFAETVFSPKIGVNVGQFSGFNAYTSLRAIVENGNSINQTYVETVDAAPPLTPFTFENFVMPDIPPVFQIEPAMKTSNPSFQATIALASARVAENGSHEVEFSLNGLPPVGADPLGFLDPNDQQFGFLIQMSNPNPQDGMFFQNPYRYTLGYVQPPTASSVDLVGAKSFGFASSTNVDPADYQSFPVEGQFVKVSAFVTSISGGAVCVGSKNVPIEKSPL